MIERFGDLDTVSLAEVNRQARLLTRVDRKYLLDLNAASDAKALEDMVGFVANKDGARLEFEEGFLVSQYRSTYLDTPQDHSFLGATRGDANRFKVRFREYLDTGDTFAEVKTRLGSETVKRRIQVGAVTGDDDKPIRATSLAATQAVRRFVTDEVLAAGGLSTAEEVRTMRKCTEVTYSRMTLLLPHDAARVTIDTDITARLMGPWKMTEKGVPNAIGYKSLVVVETKTEPGSVSAVDDFLAAREITPVRFSKYATSRVLMGQRKHGKRWRRAIKRYDLGEVVVR